MTSQNEERGKGYIQKAISAFNEIMSNNQRNMLENMNRANRGELFVLHFLSAHNAEVLPSELSSALRSSTARISALLGALEKKGQIERNIDKSNRRNILVTITGPGRERVKTEMAMMKEGMARTFDEMGKTDTIEFIKLLKRFFEISQRHMPFRGGDDGSRSG